MFECQGGATFEQVFDSCQIGARDTPKKYFCQYLTAHPCPLYSFLIGSLEPIPENRRNYQMKLIAGFIALLVAIQFIETATAPLWVQIALITPLFIGLPVAVYSVLKKVL